MVSVGTAMTEPEAKDSAARLAAVEVRRLLNLSILVVEAMPRRVRRGLDTLDLCFLVCFKCLVL